MRNIQMDIIKGLGIIFVVMGHKYDPFSWFPTNSFHLVLFVFASGYLYKPSHESNILLFFKKRVVSLLIPYCLYNVFYAIVTLWLYYFHNINLFQESPDFNFRNLVILPLEHGHQYHLYVAGWFIINLLYVQIAYLFANKLLKKITKNTYLHLAIFASMTFFGVYLGNHGYNVIDWKVILPRLLFCIGFFHLGHVFKEKLEHINIYKTSYLGVVLLIQFYLLITYKDVQYVLSWAQFNGHSILPVIASLNGIYLYLFVSKMLSKVLSENDLLVKLGRNSIHVLASHLFVFLLINIYFMKTYNFDRSALSNVWFSYQLDVFWPIYVSLGVLIPFGFSLLLEKIPISFKKIINLTAHKA